MQLLHNYILTLIDLVVNIAVTYERNPVARLFGFIHKLRFLETKISQSSVICSQTPKNAYLETNGLRDYFPQNFGKYSKI